MNGFVDFKLLMAMFLALSFCSGAQGADYLSEVKTREEFNKLSSPSFLASAFNLPSMKFVLDRASGKIYYIDSLKYFIHMDFVNEQLLSLKKGESFFKNQKTDKRRFVTGFIVERKSNIFSLEFWINDKLSSKILYETYEKIKKTFFSNIFVNLERAGLSGLPQTEGIHETTVEYQMINTGRAFGKLIFIGGNREDVVTEFGNIAVFKYSPFSLVGVTGFVLTENAESMAAHVFIMARTLRVPAFYIPDADKKLAAFKDKYVEFEVKKDTYSVKEASYEKVQEYLKSRIAEKKYSPTADLEFKDIMALKKQRSHDSIKFGAKSANLGQVSGFGINGFKIPDGFTVPFYYYGQFARENQIIGYINDILKTPALYTDFKFRKKSLKIIRGKIQNGKISVELRAKVSEELKRFKGKGVFVRSSTNAEDLPEFTGAGLYTTVPNVISLENVLEAIKTVWASVYNERAFEAREVFGIEHKSVLPAVLIQEGVDAEVAGVMFTKSDLRGEGKDCVEIAAKRGLGIRVVEGHEAPERLIYCPQTDTLKVLSLSKDDIKIRFKESGGVENSKTKKLRPALNPVLAKKLAKIGLEIEKGFGEIPQDIEWLITGGDIYIVQSRAYNFEI